MKDMLQPKLESKTDEAIQSKRSPLGKALRNRNELRGSCVLALQAHYSKRHRGPETDELPSETVHKISARTCCMSGALTEPMTTTTVSCLLRPANMPLHLTFMTWTVSMS